MDDSTKVLKVGQYVRYIRNGKEHKGRITSLSSCTCGLAGHVDCRCEGGTMGDHTIPLIQGHHAELVPKHVFCLLPIESEAPLS
jgi:hypothetical protein